MTYSVNVNDLTKKLIDGGWDNLTAELIREHEPTLLSFIEEYDIEGDTEEERIQNAKDSDSFYDLVDAYHPMDNTVHVLQHEPSDEEVLTILTHAPNVSILRDYNDGYENHCISLNGCGMDLSDHIAYAYLVIDRVIPQNLIRWDADALHYSISDTAKSELSAYYKEED